MISVEEALAKVLSYADVLDVTAAPILDTLGQVLAEDVYSSIDVPPLANAAMDGYAVLSQDTAGASRQAVRYLKVIDIIPAGTVPRRRVSPGTAIRIMTGAPVPAGADSVIPFELTDETESHRAEATQIGILFPITAGANIREAGEDIKRGDRVLSRGTVITPSHIGVLASLGLTEAKVIRRPVVAVLATGDEVVEIGHELPEGKIYNSNSYSVAALIKQYGGIPLISGIAPDREDRLIAKLQSMDADMLITTGGVSAGDYDIVKDVLARQGEIAFWTVRMKPGKPLAFGRIKVTGKSGEVRHIPHLGFPGNPVSSMITFELFARPAILKMMGKKKLDKPVIDVIIEDAITNKDSRRIFARAIVSRSNGQYTARLTGPQGSGILTSMSRANALVIVPEDRSKVKPGETLKALMLDWSEDI